MKRILIYTSLVILLFIIGFIISKEFIEFSTSLLNLNKTDIIVYSLKSQFNQSLLLGLTLSIIPLIQLLTNRINKNVPISKNNYLISLTIIVLTGVVSWLMRVFQLNNKIESVNSFNLGEKIHYSMSYENLYFTLYFTLYLLIGFLIGGLISLLVLKHL